MKYLLILALCPWAHADLFKVNNELPKKLAGRQLTVVTPIYIGEEGGMAWLSNSEILRVYFPPEPDRDVLLSAGATLKIDDASLEPIEGSRERCLFKMTATRALRRYEFEVSLNIAPEILETFDTDRVIEEVRTKLFHHLVFRAPGRYLEIVK